MLRMTWISSNVMILRTMNSFECYNVYGLAAADRETSTTCGVCTSMTFDILLANAASWSGAPFRVLVSHRLLPWQGILRQGLKVRPVGRGLLRIKGRSVLLLVGSAIRMSLGKAPRRPQLSSNALLPPFRTRRHPFVFCFMRGILPTRS